jgi:hypothetical protein
MLVKRALLLVALFGCGDPGQLGRSVVSPTDETARVALSDVPVLGADVTVERTDDTSVKGELLAATDKDLTVFLASGAMVRISAEAVHRVAIKRYDNGVPTAALATWAVAGALGGISHGILGAFSQPSWAAVAAGAIVPVAADQGRFTYAERKSDFTFLHEYARFPQGLPPRYAQRVH